jgi:hypothetical protein
VKVAVKFHFIYIYSNHFVVKGKPPVCTYLHAGHWQKFITADRAQDVGRGLQGAVKCIQ